MPVRTPRKPSVTLLAVPCVAGQLLFVSGQVPLDPATGQIVGGDIADTDAPGRSTIWVPCCKAGGRSFADVAPTVFLADMNDFATVNEVYGIVSLRAVPARATVQVARLPKDARVEIDLIATFD